MGIESLAEEIMSRMGSEVKEYVSRSRETFNITEKSDFLLHTNLETDNTLYNTEFVSGTPPGILKLCVG